MIQKSHRKRRTCRGCASVFIRAEHDDPDSLYCNRGPEERPKCGSNLMGETYHGGTDEEFGEADDAWREWAKAHLVSESGLCDEWIPTCDLCEAHGGVEVDEYGIARCPACRANAADLEELSEEIHLDGKLAQIREAQAGEVGTDQAAGA